MVEILAGGVEKKRQVTFFFPSADGRRVMLAGSFNDWEPELSVMKYNSIRGGYVTTFELAPGEYEYKFVCDDEWIIDEGNPNFVANDFGTLNSVVKVV